MRIYEVFGFPENDHEASRLTNFPILDGLRSGAWQWQGRSGCFAVCSPLVSRQNSNVSRHYCYQDNYTGLVSRRQRARAWHSPGKFFRVENNKGAVKKICTNSHKKRKGGGSANAPHCARSASAVTPSVADLRMRKLLTFWRQMRKWRRRFRAKRQTLVIVVVVVELFLASPLRDCSRS